MGSFGNTWLRCTWCAKWGKCLAELPEDVTPLTDIDMVGQLCDPCYYRFCPPHYDYMKKLLLAKLPMDSELVELIAHFAYPICWEVQAWNGE